MESKKKYGLLNIFFRFEGKNNEMLHAYKIIQLPSEHDPRIHFQLALKQVIIKMTPEEIMHSNFLLGFSKSEIVIITHLGTQKELGKSNVESKSKFLAKIVQQLFGKGGKAKFMLKMPEQEQLLEAIPEEVMINKEALNMLEGYEAAMIGYVAAENRMLEIRKQTGSVPTCHLLKHDLSNNQITYLDLERNNQHTLLLEAIFYNKDLLALFPRVTQEMISFITGEMHQKRIHSKKQAKLKLISYTGKQAEYRNEAGEVIKADFLDLGFEPVRLDQFSPEDRDIIRFAAGELAKEKEIALRFHKKID